MKRAEQLGVVFTFLVGLLGACEGHELSARRSRRGPAVWGAPVPDYSSVSLEGSPIYMYAILFTDSRIDAHYDNNTGRVQHEIMRLSREANKYFNQLDIRLVIVDILPTGRNNLSLYSFEEFVQSLKPSLPYHDFAALISYRYAGGLAFVNGMCSSKNVMLAGFYPHNPQAMGSIFFHEVAHLLGVSHEHATKLVTVSNCVCPHGKGTESHSAPHNDGVAKSYIEHDQNGGCLRIPGFDHNCTVQIMANMVQHNRCLPRVERTAKQNIAEGYEVIEIENDPLVFHICGNHVTEVGEECDCGLPDRCTAWNCDPRSCTRIVPLWKIVASSLAVLSVVFCAISLWIRSKYKKYSHVQTPMAFPEEPKLSVASALARMLRAAAVKLAAAKQFLCTSRQRPRKQKKKHLPAGKLDAASIVVVRNADCLKGVETRLPKNLPQPCAPNRIICDASGRNVARPHHPPPRLPNANPPMIIRPQAAPPRPPQSLKTVANHRHRDRALNDRQRFLDNNITYKFADFDD